MLICPNYTIYLEQIYPNSMYKKININPNF